MSNERPVNPDTSTLTEGLKRKRGRPKKQPQEEALGPLPVKKPRGRPKGSKKVTAVSGQMVGPSAGKRPRGRPRKWPQLVVQEGVSQEGNRQGSSDLNSNLAPATQGLKLDKYNYMGLNCAAMLLANHACTPRALALAAVILVNPTEENLEGFPDALQQDM
ncbi:uncharacterized protein LOC114014896 isoform X1 [Falco cherrug]|uniref:uncharacterized protein LOC114014896 isoform X1 n=1 Tax=Falco cherrug TaxID=345164 RepID=UPI0024792782|nr:uncharacterized protein LOC114014896 isoform X1 [Falco cherrug]XP_055564143.1 uncharacterized protein LOC114014896 isoform X1 [Falco cherrug]